MKLVILISALVYSVGSLAYPKVEIDTLIDFTSDDSAALYNELEIVQSIFENDNFWTMVKEANYGCANLRDLFAYRKRKSEFPRQSKDKHTYTSQEIHDLLWNGDDEIGEPKDGKINLRLKAYDHIQTKREKRKKLIKHGSTNKNTLIIKSNRKTRIHSKRRGDYACHLIHEYIHVLGFRHKTKRPSKTTKKCGAVDVPLRIQLIAKAVLNDLN